MLSGPRPLPDENQTLAIQLRCQKLQTLHNVSKITRHCTIAYCMILLLASEYGFVYAGADSKYSGLLFGFILALFVD